MSGAFLSGKKDCKSRVDCCTKFVTGTLTFTDPSMIWMRSFWLSQNFQKNLEEVCMSSLTHWTHILGETWYNNFKIKTCLRGN